MSCDFSLVKKKSAILIVLTLVILVLVVYWPVQNYAFLKYDDYDYVVLNYRIQSGITFKSIADTFTNIYSGNWHPLTMLSHMLDWHLFGDKAGGHHWTSLVIHILNTVLLFLFFNTTTGAIWRSAVVAALFAIHPINVESVAWIAERKNVLSTFFWITTMLLYILYIRLPGWKRYLPVILSLALGLMAKPMLVTLPFVLLLLDYWPLNRTTINQLNEEQSKTTALVVKKEKISFLILEKLPLLALSAISICVTLYAQRSVNTVASLDTLPLLKRIPNIIVSYGLYIKKLFWPVDLAAFYPHWGINLWHVFFTAFMLVMVTVFICKYFRKLPYLSVGWFWYLGTLVPVIGLVQVGAQSMADRYAYVPFIGLFIMISWGIYGLLRKLTSAKVILATASLIILALTTVSYFQVAYWRDTFTLFTHTLNVTENNFVAHYMLAGELLEQGKIDEAIRHYQSSLLLSNQKYIPLFGLGRALSMQGKYDEAIAAFRQAIKINPKSAESYDHLCKALEKMGRRDEAIEEYRKLLKLVNDHPGLYNNFGNVLLRQGNYDEAIKQYNEALRIRPTDAGAYYNSGLALMQQGKMDEALKCFQRAIALNPQSTNAYYQSAIILRKKGLIEESKSYYKEAMTITRAYQDRK